MISHDLFTFGIPVLEKVLRTVGVYLGILLLLRLAGKRDLAQLNTFDLVVLLLLSNVVQNAIIGNDNSLTGGLLGALVLVAVNSAVVRTVGRDERIVSVVEGTSTAIVTDGRLDRDALVRLGLRPTDVEVAIRRQGASTIAEVAEATLSPGGAIVVRLRDDAENATKGDITRLEAKLDRLLQARQ